MFGPAKKNENEISNNTTMMNDLCLLCCCCSCWRCLVRIYSGKWSVVKTVEPYNFKVFAFICVIDPEKWGKGFSSYYYFFWMRIKKYPIPKINDPVLTRTHKRTVQMQMQMKEGEEAILCSENISHHPAKTHIFIFHLMVELKCALTFKLSTHARGIMLVLFIK